MSDAVNSVAGLHYLSREPIRVFWRKGRVEEIRSESEVADNTWLAPGLIDLQINGYAGIDFQQDGLSSEHLLVATRGLQLAGCTGYLLTLITDDWSRLLARLRHLHQLRTECAELRTAILGWHIEGPFLSPEAGYRGAHQPLFMMDPGPERIRELRQAVGEDVVLLTLAPERPRAFETIQAAVACGMRVSLGHTDASVPILQQAVTAGATGFTHLANGCPRMLNRHDNILWRVLETPGLRVSLIPDKIHVSPPLFRILHRLIDPQSIYYTTDAMAAAGAVPGRYRLGEMELEVGPDQIVRQPGAELFAGSALRPVDGVFRAAAMLGCAWQEAWQRFSLAPAQFMGVHHDLAVGQPARFCLLRTTRNQRLAALRAFSGGTEAD